MIDEEEDPESKQIDSEKAPDESQSRDLEIKSDYFTNNQHLILENFNLKVGLYSYLNSFNSGHLKRARISENIFVALWPIFIPQNGFLLW